MSRTTKKRKDSILLTNIITKMEEEGCEYHTGQENSQISSPYEGCEDGTTSTYKSHSVLTFATCSFNSVPTKRIKLNDSLSYCMIPITNQNKFNHHLSQNNSSTTIQSNSKIQRELSTIDSNTSETIKDSRRSSFKDYESYVLAFPNYRLGRICNYKFRKNGNQQYNYSSHRRNQLQPSLSLTQPLDYQNLVQLFTNKHFSVQIVDSTNNLDKCLNFIKDYSLKSLNPIEPTIHSPSQNQASSYYPQSYSNMNSQKQKKSISNSIMNQNKSDSTQIIIQRQQQQYGQLTWGKLEVQNQLENNNNNNNNNNNKNNNNKSIKFNIGYQLLLKNIQYGIIKEITGIQKIDFSQRTISKVIHKFILFLKGDYRSLKYYDLDHKFEKETAVLEQGKHSSVQQNNNFKELAGSNLSTLEFEMPTFDLYELLEEQDLKEQMNSANPQKQRDTSKKNPRHSYTSNSSQPLSEKSGEDRSHLQYQSKKGNHQQDQQILQDQSLQKIKMENQNESAQQNNLFTQEKGNEDQAIQSESSSPSNKVGVKIEQPFLSKNESTFCGESEQNLNATSKNNMKQKQTLFNLSKYLMHLILEFLSEEHLEGLDIIPGFLPLVQQVIKRIKKKGQRTEHSQTYYYNHSHYNCLFLLLNSNSIDQIHKQDELLQLHQFVFEITDFSSPYFLTYINIIKSIIARIIIKQFKIIRSMINAYIATNPAKYSNYKNYMITKLQYFERVYQGIQNLKKGSFLVRF